MDLSRGIATPAREHQKEVSQLLRLRRRRGSKNQALPEGAPGQKATMFSSLIFYNCFFGPSVQPVSVPTVTSQTITRPVIPGIAGKSIVQALVERALKHKSHRVGRHLLKLDICSESAQQYGGHVLLREIGKVQVDIMLDREKMLPPFIPMVPGVKMTRPEVHEH